MDSQNCSEMWLQVNNVQNFATSKQAKLTHQLATRINQIGRDKLRFHEQIFWCWKTWKICKQNNQITYQINSVSVVNENCSSSVSSARFPNNFWIQNGSLLQFFYKVETMARKRRCRVSLQNFFRVSQFSCQNLRKTPN